MNTHRHFQYIHIFREIPSEKPPGCCIVSAKVYLKRCIAATEFFIFSGEFFDTLHQSFCSCKVLFLLPLQSRCQVWNLTSNTTQGFVHFCDRNHDFCVKKGQGTSSTGQHVWRFCPSRSSSSLLSVFWNPALIWHWLVEDPESPQRKWMELRRGWRRHVDVANFKTPKPFLSVHRSTSQSQLQTSELSASVLGKLSGESLVPFLPSSSEPKYGGSNHQSPSFA